MVHLVAVSSTGYTFAGWQENGITIHLDSTLLPFPANANRTITALFTQGPGPASIIINALPGAGGTVNGSAVNGGMLTTSGAKVDLKAAPAAGNIFVGWFTETGAFLNAIADRTLEGTQTTTHRTLRAGFAAPGFVRVTGITGVPAVVTANLPLSLAGSVVTPAAATNSTIIWSVVDPGTTGAFISNNRLYTTAAGTVKFMATVVDGMASGINFNAIYTRDVVIAPAPPVPTSGFNVHFPYGMGGTIDCDACTHSNCSTITGFQRIPLAGYINLLATPTFPNMFIGWFDQYDVQRHWGALLNYQPDGHRFYQARFLAPGTASVADIIPGMPTAGTRGLTPLPITATAVPVSAPQTIIWSVVDPGTTGAFIMNHTNNLFTTGTGTVTLLATIVNGRALGMHYTKTYNITITN
jgi:hypothetical protein